MVLVGAPEHPAPVEAFSVIGKRRSLAGSAIGGIAETQRMLDYLRNTASCPRSSRSRIGDSNRWAGAVLISGGLVGRGPGGRSLRRWIRRRRRRRRV
jgi:hypothetical protein